MKATHLVYFYLEPGYRCLLQLMNPYRYKYSPEWKHPFEYFKYVEVIGRDNRDRITLQTWSGERKGLDNFPSWTTNMLTEKCFYRLSAKLFHGDVHNISWKSAYLRFISILAVSQWVRHSILFLTDFVVRRKRKTGDSSTCQSEWNMDKRWANVCPTVGPANATKFEWQVRSSSSPNPIKEIVTLKLTALSIQGRPLGINDSVALKFSYHLTASLFKHPIFRSKILLYCK